MTDFFGGAMMQSHRTGQPTGTAHRRKASTKGEVNMNTPNTAELLVQQAKEAERLRLMLQEINRLAKEAGDLDEFRRALDRLNQQK